MTTLPMKKEKGLIAKIKNFFRKIFYHEKELQSMQVEKENETINESKAENEDYINSIQVESNQNDVIKERQLEIDREAFINEINKNPKILDSLPIEKLQKIDGYCDVIINKYKEKIKKAQNLN